MKTAHARVAGPRLFCDLPLLANTEITLPQAAARHIAALRLHAGDALTVFSGLGGEYQASLIDTTKRGTRVRVHDHIAIERESALNITLALGISAGDRMDFSLQKATELGVTAIQPLATERSVVRLASDRAEKRLAHWQNVVIAACEQCGRNRVPRVAPVLALTNYLASVEPSQRLLMLTPGAALPLKQSARADAATLLIGAEGGLSPNERAAAALAGFEPVSLGPRILRTETAPVAAIAVLQTLWGDL
jgi:16S rRNA (uracil1498-N3)-methyltransferase